MIRKYAAKLLRKLVFAKTVLEAIAQFESRIAARWARSAHRRLKAIQWGIPPYPEHFDHNIDLYYQWPTTRNSLWLERGVFGSLALQGGSLLELSCGDGFNAKHFYSLRSAQVIACDFDSRAIATANSKHGAPNIRFVLADIRTQMPQGEFENIVWDAAIEHFTEEEIAKILADIKARLTENGVLSGYTIVENQDGSKSLEQHEYEFKSKQELMKVFTPHFKNVTVFETLFPDRHNLYFWASNGCLPFGREWQHAISSD